VSDVFQPDQLVGGRYRVVRKIGGGGMADVYLCEDLTLGRRVAIKVLLQRLLNDPTFVERFRREAKAAAGLNSANVVGVYDWGELEDAYYIVMEYVEGETLKDLVRRQGRLGGAEAVHITLQLLTAVAYAHRRGIIHRDIKPQNVMLDHDGNVKVTDFGIARAKDSGMTEVGSVLGTAQYLAPEQAQGQQVDERSDLYSVGIVLYEMLTGTVPFKGDTAVTVALKHVNEAPPEPSQIVPGMPYALNQIVLKAISKDRNARYQTADEFARDLRSALAGGPLIATAYDSSADQTQLMTVPGGGTTVMAAEPLEERVSERGRKRRAWPVVLLVAVLLLAIGGAAYGLVRAMGGGGTAVPSVIGQSTAAAIATLKDAGFAASVAGDEFSDEYAEGDVVRQEPKAGTDLRKGDTVDLYVSKGAETLSLADFKGWSAAEVRDWLKGNGLSGVEKTGKSAAVEAGLVFKQEPAAGADVKRGDSITYWVSSGDPQATVPSLAGMTQEQAEAALAAAKLKIGAVTTETSTAVATGLVIRQDPPAGAKVARGAAVSIVLSSGPPSPSPSPTPTPSDLVTIPNVYTMDAATATATLESAGFKVKTRKQASDQTSGTVIAVTPDVGESAPRGSEVVLVIAK
jgi:serine/threonine-protein kinase